MTFKNNMIHLQIFKNGSSDLSQIYSFISLSMVTVFFLSWEPDKSVWHMPDTSLCILEIKIQ